MNTAAMAVVIMKRWKAARRVFSEFKILDFSRAEFGLFRNFLVKSHGVKP